MPDLGPVHQVPGMEDRYPGDHCKGGAHHIVIPTLAGDGRIGIAALKDWIVKLIGVQRVLPVHLVLSLIEELGKKRWVPFGIRVLSPARKGEQGEKTA